MEWERVPSQTTTMCGGMKEVTETEQICYECVTVLPSYLLQ